jgi:hypothetical protein
MHLTQPLESPDFALSVNPTADVFGIESVDGVPAYPTAMSSYEVPSFQSTQVVVTATPTVQTTQQKGVLDYLRQIGSNVLGSLKTTGQAIVQGGIEGGITASSGAQTGARVGATGASLKVSILLAVGVTVLALYYISKGDRA